MENEPPQDRQAEIVDTLFPRHEADDTRSMFLGVLPEPEYVPMSAQEREAVEAYSGFVVEGRPWNE